MSQEKVDKYKEEKKNRKKTIKINKIKKLAGVLVVSLGIGAVIGIPLGKGIYNYQKKQAELHRTIASSEYSAWFDEKWSKDYSDIEASQKLQDLMDQLNSATVTDAASDTDAE
ncbi:MAG: hypothetical protein K6E27_12585 [Eubacterium sp.]|nr:hypothetical protein [Eubacterium sp.]